VKLGDLTLNIIVEFLNSEGRIKSFNTTLSGTDAQFSRTTESSNRFAAANERSGATVVKLQDRISGLGLRLMGLRMLWTEFSRPFEKMIDSYQEQEIANEKLLNGLHNVGEGYREFISLQKQAESLMSVTPFDDSEIMNAQSMLTTFKKTKDEIEVLTPRILDLAAAYKQNGDQSMSLQQIAVMVGKVNEETIGALRRVGVAFTEQEADALKAARGLEQANMLAKILDSNFKGMAETIGNTSAGQWQIFKNKVGEVTESLGAFISLGAMPTVKFLGSIADKLNLLPDRVKAVALGIGALAIAMRVLEINSSPTFKIIVLIAAVLAAMPPGIRAVTGALALLTFAIIAMNSGLAMTSATLGGIPILLGLFATGVLALTSSLGEAAVTTQDFKAKMDEGKKTIDEYGAEAKNAEENVKSLKAIQDSLSVTTVRSQAEQGAYNEQLQKVAAVFPEVVSGTDNYSGSLTVNSAALQEVIDREEKRKMLYDNLRVEQLVKNINDLTKAHSEDAQELDELIVKQRTLNQEIKGGGYVIENAFGGSHFRSVREMREELDEINKRLGEASPLLQSYKTAFMQAIVEAKKTEDVERVLKGVEAALGTGTPAADRFFATMSQWLGPINQDWNELAAVIARTIGLMNQVTSPMGPEAPTPDNINEAIKLKNEQIGKSSDKNVIRSLQEDVKALTKQRDDMLGVKKPGSGSSKKKDITNEIEDIEKQISDIGKRQARTNPDSFLFAKYQKQIDDLLIKIQLLKENFKQLISSEGLMPGQLQDLGAGLYDPVTGMPAGIAPQELTEAERIMIYGKTKEEVKQNGFYEDLKKSKTVAEQIQGIINAASGTLFSDFLRALQVTQQIVELMQTLKIADTFFSLFKGAATGGLTGGLVPDLPIGGNAGPEGPMWTPRGENGNSVMNRLLSGTLLGSLTGNSPSYASSAANGGTHIVEVPYILKAEVPMKKLSLGLERYRSYDSKIKG
jgi:hypothetical protein